jgi:hypothetical protein
MPFRQDSCPNLVRAPDTRPAASRGRFNSCARDATTPAALLYGLAAVSLCAVRIRSIGQATAHDPRLLSGWASVSLAAAALIAARDLAPLGGRARVSIRRAMTFSGHAATYLRRRPAVGKARSGRSSRPFPAKWSRYGPFEAPGPPTPRLVSGLRRGVRRNAANGDR